MSETEIREALRRYDEHRAAKNQRKQLLDEYIGIPRRSSRFSNRPTFNPETALGVQDPDLNRGLGGFLEQDPVSAAKGLGIALPAAAPDIVGLAQQGLLAGGKFIKDNYMPGLPDVEFGTLSGDPLRESIGLDPDSPQGIVGEVFSPVGTAMKGLFAGAKATAAGAKFLAGFPLAALVLPETDTAARLGRKLARKPGIGVQVNEPRTLLAEGQIPFTIGKLSTNDWIKRTESILSPEEIVEARNWYSDIYSSFKPVFGDDTDTFITAFLIANKNASPTESLKNALRVAEQMHHGAGGKKGGLNDAALRRFLNGEEITSGLGQKLLDFIDSAFNRSTRTLYGHAPEAGYQNFHPRYGQVIP